MRHTTSQRALWALPLLLASCAGTRTLADPTLLIQTEGGRELGVSTEYGVVFLGHTSSSGDVNMTVWFGDGPSIEKSAIEPLGGDLFTAETEIRLPSVPLSFDDPTPGDVLTIIGREGGSVWSEDVLVLEDPRVYGLLLAVPEKMRGRNDQIGAGVYTIPDGDLSKMHLVGIAAGVITLSTAEGEREYLAAYGPQQLWRLVTHRRDHNRRKPWIYREDIL
ncbi:MAG: hypothetical protein MK291_12870 [Planctomycetes bacterium]|nr:hypothetical protein [Planctomycetota bacterium]